MQIERKQITIRELVQGYKDKGLDGVVAYDGMLDVRPAYQREYIYPEKLRDEVIRSVMKGFPLNVMYWSKVGDHYELMDGQQRTISVCKYIAEGEQTFSVDHQFFFNLQEDQRGRILDYPLDIYVCDGTPSEVLSWFRIINIPGLRLTDQELRNTSYTGPWLADAKIHFSKPTCAACNMAKDYMTARPIRQEYLQVALSWIVDRDGLAAIEDYMAKHQNDANASQLWIYFQKVIQWVEAIFTKKRSEMKCVAWGLLYNAHKDEELDPDTLEAEVFKYMIDDEVTAKKGIYQYVLDGDERNLSLREFTPSQKRLIFERDGGKCQKQKCGVVLEDVNHGEFDHVKPWSEGGKTEVVNGQLLCRDCNRRKGTK